MQHVLSYNVHFTPFYALEVTCGASARRADDASGGCTWRERAASVHHASHPTAGRPRAGRVAVAPPYKGIARGSQISLRGGSRELPGSKALR